MPDRPGVMSGPRLECQPEEVRGREQDSTRSHCGSQRLSSSFSLGRCLLISDEAAVSGRGNRDSLHVANSVRTRTCLSAQWKGALAKGVSSKSSQRGQRGLAMYAYVINLARSTDRQAHITAELERAEMDFEIVPAVDGRTLDLSDSTLVDPSLVSRCQFPAGAAGCALSHFRIYQKILEDSRDRALVLEDDVLLPADLSDLGDVIADHLTGAEVALLNYASFPPGPLRMSLKGSVDLPSSRLLALPIDARQLVNAGAYVITREACARMIEHLLPIRATADDWRFYYEEGFLDRVRCVLPRPVPKSPNFESTIGFYSLGSGVRARLVGPFVRYKIPFLHQAILYRRRRIMRHWDRAEVVDIPFIEKPSRLG